MKISKSLWMSATAALLMTTCASAMAMNARSSTQFGHNITVESGESVEEVTCFGCSVHIRGAVAGDVTTFGGSVVIEEGGSAGGDVTVFAGDVRLASGTNVGGDLVTMGGRLRRDSGANIGGDVTEMAGAGWLIGIFLLPLIILGGIIALLVWLVQRMRRPAVPLAA